MNSIAAKRVSKFGSPTRDFFQSLESRVLLSAALVRDININSSGSNPSAFTPVGSNVFFLTSDPYNSTTKGLWFSDGTTANTTKVRDFSSPSQGVQYLTPFNGALYFVTSQFDGLGLQVWRSNGTNAGTVQVTQFPASNNSNMRIWSYAGKLFVYANDGSHGYELFASDGTWAGTQLLKDLYPGSNSSDAGGLVEVNGKTYFFANDGVHGKELFGTDGTTAGTAIVADLTPGTSSTSFYGDPISLVDKVVFSCNGDGKGSELWQSDGSALGTSLLVDIQPGSAGSSAGSLSRVGNRVYFTANTGSIGYEPWFTDGTSAGTYLLGDLNPGPANSNAGAIDVNGLAVISAEVGTSRGLYVSDGSPGNFAPLVQAPSGSIPFGSGFLLGAAGGWGYFTWHDVSSGIELWRTDGTLAETLRITDIAAGAKSADVRSPAVFGSKLIFNANDSISGAEPYLSNGTEAGTARLKECGGPPRGSSPSRLSQLNGKIIFGATAEINSVVNYSTGSTTTSNRDGIFVSDGTESGTVPLRLDLTVTGLAAIGDLVYFNTSSGLWRTDGTTAGTLLLRSGVGASFFTADGSNRTAFLNGFAYFGAGSGADFEVWKSDGTPDGTTRVIDLWAGTTGSRPQGFLAWQDEIYFSALAISGGRELYATNGTAAGTRRVADINPTGDAFSVFETTMIVATQDNLYFAANDGTHGFELWKSDGTTAGTTLVKDMRPGNQDGMARKNTLAAIGDKVFTTASGALADERVWVSDGTSAGTIPLTPIASANQPAIALGSKAFFSTYDSAANQYTLWTSDGTLAGTTPLYTTPTGAGDVFAFKGVLGSQLFFNGFDAAHGQELWRTDGTIAGTVLDTDIEPGTGGSSPSAPSSDLSPISGNLFYAATRSDVGRELWRTSAADAEPLALKEKLDSPIGGAQLTWTYPQGGETGFTIERGTTLNSFAPVGTSGAGVYGFVDSTAVLDTQYYYRVRATLTGFDSAWSNIVSVNHPAAASAPNLLADADSGLYSDDNLTNATVLRFSVTTPVGASSRILVDGVDAGVFEADTRGVAWVELSGITQGTHAFTSQIVYSPAESSAVSSALMVTVDRTSPTITSSAFQVDLDVPTFQLVLSEASNVVMLATQYSLKNRTTNAFLNNANLATQYSSLNQTVSITAPGLSGGLFADGNYRFEFNNGVGFPIFDLAGNPISLSGTWDFYSLAGDANRDRMVDTFDFNILAGNFGSGDKFSLADFNYDNTVDSQDFTILVGKFGKRLPVASALAASPSLWSGTDLDDDQSDTSVLEL